MNPLSRLREILQDSSPTTGKVARNDGASIYVATKAGVKVYQKTGNYSVGDEVALGQDSIKFKLNKSLSLPVYFV